MKNLRMPMDNAPKPARGFEVCDRWWEAETEWHRHWKDRFLPDWQEVALLDERTGELHIADVRTASRLIIEFQRSSIHPTKSKLARQMARETISTGTTSNIRSRVDGTGMVDFIWHGRSQLFERWHATKFIFIGFSDAHGFWRILRYHPTLRRRPISSLA